MVSASDIISLTMEREKRKRKATTKCSREEKKKKAHCEKYFHSYENQRSLFEDRAGSAHFVISFDPPKDGNCQFAAIYKLLSSIGIHRSNHTSITLIITPLLPMGHHCKILQICRGLHIFLQCPKMVHLVTT